VKKVIFTIALTVTAITAFANNNQTTTITPIKGQTQTITVHQAKNNLIVKVASQTTLAQSGPRLSVGSCVSGCVDGL